jgi:hypothetical protein
MARLKLLVALCLFVTPIFAQDPAARLNKDLRQLRYEDLEHDLASAPPNPTTDLFNGILANRSGHLAQSIALLEAAIPAAEKSTPQYMGNALLALGDDYFKTFRYADADRVYTRLLATYATQLDPADRQDAADDESAIHLLINAPPQTLHLDGPVDLPTYHDPLGSYIADVTVSGITGPWILDTGANISVISETYARQLHITLSTGTAQTKGATGAENTLHVGVIPELHLGAATLTNVAVLIFPDKNIAIQTGPKSIYQINAILGFPVFQALGVITFTHAGRLLAGDAALTAGHSSRMFMDKFTPLLEAGIHGKPRLFQFDTGANNTVFFLPFYNEFSFDVASAKHGNMNAYGAGGTLKQKVSILPQPELEVAGHTVTLKNIAVYSVSLGTTADETYGNLGRDLVANFDSFTLDLTSLRFFLGKPLPQD